MLNALNLKHLNTFSGHKNCKRTFIQQVDVGDIQELPQHVLVCAVIN